MGLASLSLRLPWDAVCTALGIPYHTKALPLRTRCPLCHREALNLYDDTISGGQWHHCRACGSSGDLIELTCSTWDLPASAAMQRLAASGVPIAEKDLSPEIIDRYSASYPQQRKRFLDFWETARQQYFHDGSAHIQQIRNRYHLQLNVSAERWAIGPGQLIGSCARRDAEGLFHPACITNKLGFDNYAGPPRFKGKKWDRVLALPFYSLPNLIQSYMFLGRDGDLPGDQVFWQIVHKKTDREAGLAHLTTLGDTATVIAVDDWLLAMQIQFRNFLVSYHALPFVIWHDDGISRTQNAWHMLGGKRIIFWPQRLDARVVRQAVETDGLISLCGPATPNRKSIADYLRHRPSQSLINAVACHAKPWPVALRNWMAKAPEGEVSDLLLRLEHGGVNVGNVLSRAGSDVSRDIPKPLRRIQFGRATITEQHDTWYSETSRGGNKSRNAGGRLELINAVVKMTHLIRDNGTSELFYRGEIRHRGCVVPFIERVAVLRKQFTQWLEVKMAESRLGALAFHCDYTRQLHQIALLFHAPETVHDDLWRWVDKLKQEKQ